jgi:hypothetical protein
MAQKWSILWKSIVASSLEATLFPYCRYIKTLDLRDLKNLLEDDQFKGKVLSEFFSGPLAQFHRTTEVRLPSGRKFKRLDFASIIDAVGEVVTKHTPMLDQISGELLSTSLIRWTPRLPRLETLEFYDGSPLEDDLLHASIHEHCPNFNSLSIYTWLVSLRMSTYCALLT